MTGGPPASIASDRHRERAAAPSPPRGRPNVHYLRTLADARRSERRPQTRDAPVVVGAGFIGQEVAATARGLDVEVTLLEAAPAPLTSILG